MKNRAFTLIEMMMVLIIIGILMGLTLAAVFTALKSAKVSNAEADIATLEASISMYEVDMGDYPALNPAGNNSFKAWLEDSQLLPWNGPYMHFKSENLTSGSDPVLDPWNNAYQYHYDVSVEPHSGSHHSGYFDIWSNGPDKTSGTSDDITNW